MSARVEAATPRDLPAMMGLMRQLADEHAGIDEVFQPAEDWYDATRRMFLDRLAQRDHYLAVARDDGQVTGMVTALLRRVPGFRLQRRAVIENLVVDAAHRRDGVGRALVDAAMAWCGRRGCDCLELSVAAGNHAGCAFWEALGFRPVVVRMHKAADGRGR